MNNAITISFDRFSSALDQIKLSSDDIEKLRRLIVTHPEMPMIVEGLPYENYLGYVEDDLEEILTAYSHLERQVLSDKHETHTVFFGQGGLLIATDIFNDMARITIERSPYLNKHLTTKHSLDVSARQYLASWRMMLHSLLQAVNSLDL